LVTNKDEAIKALQVILTLNKAYYLQQMKADMPVEPL